MRASLCAVSQQLFIELPSNKHASDLLCARSDSVEPCISQYPTHRVILTSKLAYMEPLVEPCGSHHLYIHCHRDTALLPTPLLRLFQWSTGSPLRNPLHNTAIFSSDELESPNAHFTADTSLIASSSNGIYIGSACIQHCVHVRDLPYQHGE
jgi:hypothetical protein